MALTTAAVLVGLTAPALTATPAAATTTAYDSTYYKNAIGKTGTGSNNVILLYSGISRSKSLNGGDSGDWNREHVWAISHGDLTTSTGPGTDLHHIRPEDVAVNGRRGNLDFNEGGST